LIIVRSHLAFLNHVHQLNALQGNLGRTEGFKPEHRSNNAFDGPVVLLDKIVQILALADLDRVAGLLLECLNGCFIGTALIDRDLVR
jgi:hypothetical protein